MDDLLKYWPVALFVINGFAIWVSWTVRRGLVSREDYDAGRDRRDDQIAQINDRIGHVVTHADLAEHEKDEKQRFASIERRIGSMEKAVAAAPTKQDLERIHARLDDVVGGVKTTSGEMVAIRRQVQSINDFLLSEKK